MQEGWQFSHFWKQVWNSCVSVMEMKPVIVFSWCHQIASFSFKKTKIYTPVNLGVTEGVSGQSCSFHSQLWWFCLCLSVKRWRMDFLAVHHVLCSYIQMFWHDQNEIPTSASHELWCVFSNGCNPSLARHFILFRTWMDVLNIWHC